MTRFMMTLDDAVDLVLYAFKHGCSGDIFVQKAPAATIEVLVQALLEYFDVQKYKLKTIGTRHGEKLYEVLLSREEMVAAEDLEQYFRIPPDQRDLNYDKFTKNGDLKISTAVEYTSHNTERLSVRDMKILLDKIGSRIG